MVGTILALLGVAFRFLTSLVKRMRRLWAGFTRSRPFFSRQQVVRVQASGEADRHLAVIYGCKNEERCGFLLSRLTARGACKSMNHAQKYLAQANRQIAELAVQVASQRVIVKHALDAGQGSEMAESLLDALERSLRIFEKHRVFLLSYSVNRPNRRLQRQI